MSINTKNTERFSNRVANYISFRPGYPKEFIDALYNEHGFTKDAIIADIGSGTGILSQLLLERGNRVVGVEPNEEMRKAAEKLLDVYPRFVSISGTAEASNLDSSSVDIIVCAQAFHWFDRDACKKEFSRILKPKGKVVLVWNKRVVDKTGFSFEYEEAVKKYANDYNEVNHKRIGEAEFMNFFKDCFYTKVIFNNIQNFDLQGLKGRLLSSSYCPVLGEANHGILIEAITALFEKYNDRGKIAFKYETEAYIGEI